MSVDGDEKRYWVTATDVTSALEQIGLGFSKADLSVSRGAYIGREGLDLDVVTPKKLTVKIGGGKAKKQTVTALTVAQALDDLGVKVSKLDKVKPGLGATLEEGDKIVFTDVRKVTKNVTESVAFDTVEREDASMYSDESETVRAGKDGSRKVLYKITFVNGEVAKRKALKVTVLSAPVDAIVRVGTKERVSAANFASGSTVWDQLAQLRVRRQLGHQHRQRLLRRPAVQPVDVAVVRRHRLPAREQPREPDRRRHATARRQRRLRRLAALLAAARPAPVGARARCIPCV